MLEEGVLLTLRRDITHAPKARVPEFKSKSKSKSREGKGREGKGREEVEFKYYPVGRSLIEHESPRRDGT